MSPPNLEVKPHLVSALAPAGWGEKVGVALPEVRGFADEQVLLIGGEKLSLQGDVQRQNATSVLITSRAYYRLAFVSSMVHSSSGPANCDRLVPNALYSGLHDYMAKDQVPLAHEASQEGRINP